MGSLPQDYVLPDASASHLVLTNPTEAEKKQTWTLNHQEWGGALSLSEYLEREPYIETLPLSADGGMSHWILTDPTVEGPRPVLASGESTRKRILYLHASSSPEAAQVKEGIAYGVGSIYTYPQFRGKRYASRLLRELGTQLRTWPQRQGTTSSGKPAGERAVCSALWSDIGKDFYARKGWAPFPSVHVEFPVPITAPANGELKKESEDAAVELTPVTYSNLAALCAEDEHILCTRLLPRAARATGKTCVAFAPDHDAMRWHLYRDDFIASLVFADAGQQRGRSETKGAVATVAGSKKRVWAVWSRSYHGKNPDPATDQGRKNTLYILRLAIDAGADGKDEDDIEADDDLAAAFRAVMREALREAHAWKLAKIDMWNPTPAARRLVERTGLEHRWVEREVDSIPSLMWYGDGEEREKIKEDEEIEWVANEKFCWC
ncbi:hypothetical protein F4810DRAFT_255712 [Camillea tinctor]|nr:hypothetical protein F4810DRAFT_255712 [Camillea tinctor]